MSEEVVTEGQSFNVEDGFRGLHRKISKMTETHDQRYIGGQNEVLVHRKVNVVSEKSFIDEYRCERDVRSLSSDFNVILDSKTIDLIDLIDEMLAVSQL